MDRIWRYERKFFSAAMDTDQLYQLVKIHPAGFYEEYPERRINNIYYDTITLNHYYRHISGAPERNKIRVRWYGEGDNQVIPVLELKEKRGLINSKTKEQLSPIDLHEWRDQNFPVEMISTGSALILKELKPVVFNSYRRRYFRSFDKKFRITLDFMLNFGSLDSSSNYYSDDCILEFKYNEEYNMYAGGISQHFPQRLSKYSKYVKAIEAVYQLESTQDGRMSKVN